jgi:hypothetical protein
LARPGAESRFARDPGLRDPGSWQTVEKVARAQSSVFYGLLALATSMPQRAHPAVDMEDLPRDPVAIGLDQEVDGPRNLLRLAQAPERVQVLGFCPGFRSLGQKLVIGVSTRPGATALTRSLRGA